ncbi:hypothetical protein DK842_14675 [Chromobacterium phragmitis]|uniref:Uncharacterized protein n=1 Tax=Chromobacterium phragmitis TaxID=2202141 RepID=A0A344UMC1_9NEIS|nr:hypothetical protein [Chromobacterium phragmitis]AXE31024.1 hypothetical protein DK842_14675 [Chromobacterium phragmitis]AXE36419.1 hypothetical protein DK843_20235 [Chromobacterium phragmitis]
MTRDTTPSALDDLRALGRKIPVYWRQYLDWLADVGWGRFALLSLLAILVCGLLLLPGLLIWLILGSAAAKFFVRPRRLALPAPEKESAHE